MQFAKKLTISFNQEFKSDLDDIQRCRNSIKKEVSLAKFQDDKRHQQLQSQERQEASHNRGIMARFISGTERSMHRLGDLQLQSSHQESGKDSWEPFKASLLMQK
jgi:hypothetical protein